MKELLVLLLVTGMTIADTGLGYKYKVPQNRFGIPTYQLGSNSNQYGSAYSSGLGSSSLNSGNLGTNFGNFAPSNLGYGSLGFGRYGSSFGSDSSGISALGSNNLASSYSDLGTRYYPSSVSGTVDSFVRPLYQYSSSAGLNNDYKTQYASSSQYQTAAQDKQQSHYEIQQQPTQVFKHFYVHAAPEEPEEPQSRTPIVLPPAQKHYKIIFVKTPTESRRGQTVIPVQPQNEEKTIVYVLVKKPDEQQELIVPKIEQKPPSKPEVFFIKYKNKEDSQTLIDNIVKDYKKNDQVSILSTGANNEVYNDVSSVTEGSYNTITSVSEGSYSSLPGFDGGVSKAASGFTPSTINIGSGINGGILNTAAIDRLNTFNTDSSYGNVQYAIPNQSETSIGTNFNGYSGFSEANIASSVAPQIIISTTPSSIDYDSGSTIAAGQGIPHETYGIPKFRVK